MKRAVVLDIETIADETAKRYLGEPKIDSRLVDPVKIEKAKAAAKAQQEEDMALNPMFGRVCAYGTAGAGGRCMWMRNISDREERRVVRSALSLIDETIGQGKEIVTFNGILFDVPFLYKRAMLLGLDAPNTPLGDLVKRYTILWHFDIRMILGDWDRHAIGDLDFYAKRFGIEEDVEEVDYASFPKLIADGQGKEISSMAKRHCEKTMKLFKIVYPFFQNDTAGIKIGSY